MLLRRCRLPRGGINSLRASHASSDTGIIRCLSTTCEGGDGEHYDVLVAGGGAVGSVLTRLLIRDGGVVGGGGRPIRIGLLERRSSPPSLDDVVRSPSSFPHPRAYALSPSSLFRLGPSAMRRLSKSNRLGVYDRMQIWESDGPAALHFAGEDLDNAVAEGRLPDLDGMMEAEAVASEEEHRGDNGGGSGRRPWLGAVVEDTPLVSALWDELRGDPRVDLIDGAEIVGIDAPVRPHGEVDSTGGNSIVGADFDPELYAKMSPPPPVKVTYNTGGEEKSTTRTVTADLLVAADGANSQVRRAVGGIPASSHGYGRTAVTFTVRLRSGADMGHTAFQRFLGHGPIALLPVWNGSDNGQNGGKQEKEQNGSYANVVWSTTHSEAQRLLALPDEALVEELNDVLRRGPAVNPPLFDDDNNGGAGSNILQRLLPSPLLSAAREVDALIRTANTGITMGGWTESPSRNYFRMPPAISDVVGPKLKFDLTLSHAHSYVAPRVALVGDAAHTVHPMAGQGLNLGVDDAASLASLVHEAHDAGMDVGGTMLFLDRYDAERKRHAAAVLGGVHALHHAFAGSEYFGGAARVTARSFGVNAVNALGPVRKALAEVAAGAAPPAWLVGGQHGSR